MLWVITIRKPGERTAHNHIASDDTRDRAFCGDPVPQVVLDMWGDKRNPYQGKGTVSCAGCLAEFHTGRRTGWRGDTASSADVESGPDAPGRKEGEVTE
jgi:hypothetical protein